MSANLQSSPSSQPRIVSAVFGRAKLLHDPDWEWEYAAHLKRTYSTLELVTLFSQHRDEEGPFQEQLRRIIFRAMCRTAGHALQIGPGVVVKHPETIEIGDGVFIGAQTMIQGRFDGTCRIGNHVWIGPHSYFDARSLILDDYVGWGPGAKALGSSHTGTPVDIPIIATPLAIEPVVIGYGADIGTNATILPGVHIGAHSIVGAGAVVTTDAPEYAVLVGVPARVTRYRNH
ncbi:DapH/DapD/GlmU-related protein [Granulicella sp. dw_53]|uniref:acyltransferase n=1 Tax=Granulicella sp. dw_53 TaxID=2719792 RepID=UPI001BD3C1C8|nr:DapH/DapD/GlmU-related protein [Granulicella sp. dw_53]